MGGQSGASDGSCESTLTDQCLYVPKWKINACLYFGVGLLTQPKWHYPILSRNDWIQLCKPQPVGFEIMHVCMYLVNHFVLECFPLGILNLFFTHLWFEQFTNFDPQHCSLKCFNSVVGFCPSWQCHWKTLSHAPAFTDYSLHHRSNDFCPVLMFLYTPSIWTQEVPCIFVYFSRVWHSVLMYKCIVTHIFT